MKTRFSTIDIRAAVSEIREQFVSLRAVNIYDVDNKTYIIKFNKPDSKMMLLLESGSRLHITEYEWPKNATPSGFTMKLRKHIRSRRLESVTQLGADRIVDLQFGSGEAAYHIILELYDRGNIVLTDSELTILNILRPRTDDSQDVRFAVKEKYPVGLVKQQESLITAEGLRNLLTAAKQGDNLRKILNPALPYGPAVIEHCLLTASFSPSVGIGKGFTIDSDLETLAKALEEAETMLSRSASVCRGYIVQRIEARAAATEDSGKSDGTCSAVLLTYDEFHPFLLRQHCSGRYIEFDTFNKAVDEFFSKLEAQKIDLKALQTEKAALRKLDNVKKDHEKRLTELQRDQEEDEAKASLIEINLPLVDRAILIVNSAIANQFDWSHIWDLVREAQLQGDPVARAIKGLKLDTNHITLLLSDPYQAAAEHSSSDDDDDNDEEDSSLRTAAAVKPQKVDIDLGLSAYANAKKYYDHRRVAAEKVHKTVLASSKALRSAERTTKELLKDAQAAATISKARRVHWFEKFLWLITSENYLAVGGRDAQQNEIIVKRHLRAGDVYVHADVHGAASIVIKNPSGMPIPPKTLNEVGCMAICNSAAWDAKVVTSAWWVYHDQVSKTAPTGEYLTTGSFMVRGKKNYLPPSYLVYGFGLLFKLDEESAARHRGERRVRTADEEAQAVEGDASAAVAAAGSDAELGELDGSDSDSSGADTKATTTRAIPAVENNEPEQRHSATADSDASDEKHSINGPGAYQPLKIDLAVCDTAVQAAIGVQISSSEDETSFPDTRIRVPSVAEGDSTSRRHTVSFSKEDSCKVEPSADDTQDHLRIVIGGEVLEVGRKVTREHKSNSQQHRADRKNKSDRSEVAGGAAAAKASVPIEKEQQPPPMKRGQKSKLRKIKEKYGDQDDEERQLRMSILRSAPPPPPPQPTGVPPRSTKSGRGGRAPPAGSNQRQPTGRGHSRGASSSAGGRPPSANEAGDKLVAHNEGPSVGAADSDHDEDDPQDGGQGAAADVEMLDSLTGRPVAEDVLLFAVPFCAPYSVLQNFKYKVKLTPGTTKRGKAAKAAIQSFLYDKTVTQREKDLLKALKDVDVSRNMPGKVKVSAPNLHRSKAK